MLPNATIPITMSKFLALGMPLQEVVYRSTHKPAKVLRRPELGHLSVGSEADLAAFALHEGDPVLPALPADCPARQDDR